MADRSVSARPALLGVRAVLTAAALITLGNLASRVLGLVREGVIAALFGKTVATSAFGTAATVPNMLYDLVIGGAVSAALIPVLTEYAARRDEAGAAELGRIAGTIAALALAVLAAATAVLVVAAPWLVRVLGVEAGTEAAAQTVTFVRIVLPSVVFLGLAGVVTALLYSRQEFVYPAFAVALYNAGIIVAALLFSPAVGAASLAIGVVLGAAMQLGLQVVGLRRLRLRLSVDLKHPAVRRILRLYAPVAFGLVVSQVGIVVDRNLAWRTGDDSVAVMRFATTLIQLPLGLVATATSFAILPRLSSYAERAADLPAYKQTLALGLRLATLAIVPVTIALILWREPVVQLLFQRQAFDVEATRATATAVLYYAPQLPFVAADQLLIFAFYARRNTLTPALVGLFGVGVYLASGLLLIGPAGLGLRGLILANTLQNSLHAVVLLGLLWRAVGSLSGYGAGRTLARSALAAAPMGLACWALTPHLVLDRGELPLLGSLALATLVGGLLYVAGLALLRTEECADALRLARRAIRRAA